MALHHKENEGHLPFQ